MPPQTDETVLSDEKENIEQSSSDNNPNVFSIQKYLLILLFIQWFVFVITLGVGVYSIVDGNATDISSGIQSLIPIIALTIFYTFGLLVAYKRHRVGLLIFASVGVILFIVICILVGYILLAIIALDVGFGGSTPAYDFIVFFGMLFTVVVVVAIMTLKFSFDLAKSIKRNSYTTV